MSKEFWIETEIFPNENDWSLNNDILLRLYDNFVQDMKREGKLVAWHFFREPSLRFRVETVDEATKSWIARYLEDELESLKRSGSVSRWYFANHGRPAKLEESYSGELEQYGWAWLFQKKMWEYGAEMAVAALKQRKESCSEEPTIEYQLKRVFHLLYNQSGSKYGEIEFYFTCAVERLLRWPSLLDQQLKQEIYEKLKKELIEELSK